MRYFAVCDDMAAEREKLKKLLLQVQACERNEEFEMIPYAFGE